jgi:apolipoprotein N-acyltransferase
MKTNDKHAKGGLWLLVAGFAVLMSLPFLVPHLGFLALVGFVPLFMLDRALRELQVRHSFWYYYAAFVLFNVFTTFWIWFVSPVGAVAALLLNALQMAAVFAIGRWGGRVIRRHEKRPLVAEAGSLLFFIVTWLAWEHIYFEVELSWPWLCLGNAFLYSPRMVQWYEIFGALGGSAWILLCNAAIFLALTATGRRQQRWSTVGAALLVLVPILCSEIRYASYRETQDPLEVVVIQPNVDPFAKYGVQPQSALDARLVELMAQEVTPDTRFVITPETFTYNVNAEQPLTSPSIARYQAFLRERPGLQMLLGALTVRFYDTKAKPTRSALPLGDGRWYDRYNAALVLDGTQVYGQYVKSKLVPGVEIIPYENLLPFLGPFIARFGGSSSSYGTQDEMEAIPTADGKALGAMICYESAYGDWSRRATKKGARFLSVITNDGWWGDTPGYRQHFNFARLRAIENRRDIVQAANTGTSGIINQRGDVLAKTPYWVETTLRGTINGNDAQTPFVRHGDRLGRLAGYAFLVLGLMLLVFSVSDRRSGRGKSAAGNA